MSTAIDTEKRPLAVAVDKGERYTVPMDDDTKAIIAGMTVALVVIGGILWFFVWLYEYNKKEAERPVDMECMAVMAPANPNGITRGNVGRLVDFCTE